MCGCLKALYMFWTLTPLLKLSSYHSNHFLIWNSMSFRFKKPIREWQLQSTGHGLGAGKAMLVSSVLLCDWLAMSFIILAGTVNRGGWYSYAQCLHSCALGSYGSVSQWRVFPSLVKRTTSNVPKVQQGVGSSQFPHKTHFHSFNGCGSCVRGFEKIGGWWPVHTTP